MIGTSSLAAALAPAAVEPTMRNNTGFGRQASDDPPLGPAVILDLRPEARIPSAAPQDVAEIADEAHYRRDVESQQIVFQVVGPDGSVVEQLPSEAALRARSYAREAVAARAAEIGTAVARTA